jgi:release factor glutamine methyltransferase
MKRYFDVLTLGRQTLDHLGDDALLEAQLVLCHVMGVTRSTLLASLSDECSVDTEARFLQLISQRATGYPVQWILGCTEFMGRLYEVSEGVLIPRFDTEILVETVFDLMPEYDCIIECGVGSGVISIEIALKYPDVPIYAWDINPAAIALAQRNALSHGVTTLHWNLGDFFQAFLLIKRLAKRYRLLIVSNPPYIPSPDILTLEPTVKDFEPLTALDGGADGLYFYRQFAGLVSKLDSVGLVVEMGINQAQDIWTLFSECNRCALSVRQDLSGIDRVMTVQKRPLT